MEENLKQLLLKDLCARIPYGVKAQVKINVKYSDAHKPNSEICTGDIWGITTNKPYTAWVYSFITIYPCGPEQNMCSINECKPYLRPMLSMTEEEKRHISKMICLSTYDNGVVDDMTYPVYIPYYVMEDCLNYLRSIHVDYLGLIEKGLAFEAPKDLYDLNK